MLEDILKDLEKQPKHSEIQQEVLNLPKTNKTLITKIYIQILRISFPKKMLSTKNITYCFTNIFALPYSEFVSNIKIIADNKIFLLLSYELFTKFVFECFCSKKKVSFENNAIITDVKIDKYVFDMVIQYCNEKECTNLIFKFLVKNKKYMIVKKLLNQSIFISDINNIEDEKEFVDVMKVLKKEQKNKIEIRTINNKILLKKYIEMLITQEMNDKKRYKIKDKENNVHELQSEQKDHEKRYSNTTEPNDLVIDIDCDIYNKLYDVYKDNTIVKLMLCIERKCCNKCIEILEALKIDDDSKIRAKANQYGRFEAERILDVSKNVRSVIFERIKNENITSSDVLLLLFAGLKTNAQNEYFEILNSTKIDFSFLTENLNYEIKLYLKMKQKMCKKNDLQNAFDNIVNVEYVNITETNQKLIFCEYMVSHVITEAELMDLLIFEPFYGFLYLKSRKIYENKYESILHDNMFKIQKNEDFTRVVYFLSMYINQNKDLIINDNFLSTIKTTNIDKKQENSTNFTFEQACIYNSIIENVNQEELEICLKESKNDFYSIFFVVKHVKHDKNILKIVKEYITKEKNTEKIIEIICKSADISLLIENIQKVMEHKEKTIPQYIFENPNTVTFIILFLLSYNTTVYKASLFSKILYTICKGFSSNFDAIKETATGLLKNYIKNLNSDNKQKLYSLCCTLKQYTINTELPNYEVNNGKIAIKSIPNEDFVLYFFIDYVKEQIGKDIEATNDNIIDDRLYKQVPVQYQPFIIVQDFTKL